MTELRDPMEGAVTTADLADALDVRPETVVRWIKEQKLSAYRQRGRWYIPVDAAEDFAAEYSGLLDRQPEDLSEELDDDGLAADAGHY